MNRVMPKSKLHRATVGDADPRYAPDDREDLGSSAPRAVHVDRANRIISIDGQVPTLLAGQEA